MGGIMSSMIALYLGVFCFSLAGMLAMLLFKRYELSSGRILFVGARPVFRRGVYRVLGGVLAVPLAIERTGQWLMMHGKARAISLMHSGARSLEYVLEKVLHRVRQSAPAPRGEA